MGTKQADFVDKTDLIGTFILSESVFTLTFNRILILLQGIRKETVLSPLPPKKPLDTLPETQQAPHHRGYSPYQ